MDNNIITIQEYMVLSVGYDFASIDFDMKGIDDSIWLMQPYGHLDMDVGFETMYSYQTVSKRYRFFDLYHLSLLNSAYSTYR